MAQHKEKIQELYPPCLKISLSCVDQYRYTGLEGKRAIFKMHQKTGRQFSYPYTEIRVLVIAWQECDLNADAELARLGDVFDYRLGVNSTTWFAIPSERPYNALEKALYEFKDKYDSPDHLLIVYYSGHGRLDDNRRMTWFPYYPGSYSSWQGVHAPVGPSVDWYALQVGLEHAESDVLLLLDCCAASGSLSFADNRALPDGDKTEILAACGAQEEAPGEGPGCSTTMLIGALQYFMQLGGVFSILDVHRYIVEQSTRVRVYKDAVTPVFIRVNGQSHEPSILLRCMFQHM